jgi:hypothetical protein
MPPDHWMQWNGWDFVAVIVATIVGFYFGWDVRGTRERSRQWLAEIKTGPSVALAQMLARMKDPRTCPSIDDELDAFAHVIDTAKSIHGDLQDEDTGGHP